MAILGYNRIRPIHWLKSGMVHAKRVGRVETDFFKDTQGFQPFGTGFLIPGELISVNLTDLPVFLTCDHVISGNYDKNRNRGVPADQTRIIFEALFDDTSAPAIARIERVLAFSPTLELNYSLLLLDRWPGKLEPINLAPRPLEAGNRVYVIGHPQGGGLSVSLEDGDVIPLKALDKQITIKPHELYYRAPTERGSSGSPVFNEHWELVAMHIGGRPIPPYNFGGLLDHIIKDANHKTADVVIEDEIKEKIKNPPSKEIEEDEDFFSVFISYSHADSVFADRLYHSLQSNGVQAWLDKHAMLPGDDIYEQVDRGINLWDKVLLCCSEASLTSWWVDNEADSAFQKERDLMKERKKKTLALIPLDLDGYLFKDEWRSGKRRQILSRLVADFKDWQDEKIYEKALKRLLNALQVGGSARPEVPKQKI